MKVRVKQNVVALIEEKIKNDAPENACIYEQELHWLAGRAGQIGEIKENAIQWHPAVMHVVYFYNGTTCNVSSEYLEPTPEETGLYKRSIAFVSMICRGCQHGCKRAQGGFPTDPMCQLTNTSQFERVIDQGGVCKDAVPMHFEHMYRCPICHTGYASVPDGYICYQCKSQLGKPEDMPHQPTEHNMVYYEKNRH